MDTKNSSETTGTSAPQNAQAGMDAANKNMLMGILSYIGPLIIIPYIVAKDDPFVKFHIKQGLVLFVIEAAVWVLSMVLAWQLAILINLVNLVTIVLSIIGIVNVVQGKEKELPFVGTFSRYFPI